MYPLGVSILAGEIAYLQIHELPQEYVAPSMAREYLLSLEVVLRAGFIQPSSRLVIFIELC